ncbi:MAG: TonB-dependent receptor, partial [Deltaproteobacteria bacterium]|nr:TonB-dependent receptor [Deltaproteobacteria bacterium]
MSHGPRYRRLVLGAAALGWAWSATTAPTAAAQPALDLVPPSLLEAAAAPWPEGEPVGEARVEVPCRVSLDETGGVLEVQVLESRGEAFDAAAVAAIRASRFAPAQQDGRPIPARFVFRWVFEPPPPEVPLDVPAEAPAGPSTEPAPVETPPVPLAPTITFEGEVLGENDVPIEGAAVSIEGAGLEQPVVALTAFLGDFFVFDLPPGRYRVRVSAPQFATLEVEEEVVPGELTVVLYRLAPAAGAFETVVRSRRPPREMTRRTIETREIVRMPGTGGDSLRVVENLPGVARPQFGVGLVVVRGSAPQNTAFYVDGVQVPLLYHFGGLRSAVAADFLERIDYYPGNYSVRYGGVTAGIVDVVPRRPDREAWSGYVDVSLIDTGAFVEGPLAENASLALGLRRSYVDAVLAAVQEMVPFDTLQAPVYWDFQALADWEPSPDDELSFFAYGSDDRFSVLIDDLDAGGPTLVGERTLATSFYRFQADWRRRLGDDAENRLLLGVGYNEFLVRAGVSFDALQGFVPIQLRDELTWKASDAFRLSLGIDTTVTW